MTIRAAVCRAFGQPLVIEHLVVDSPQRGEVRVDIKTVAVCGSDVHAAAGAWEDKLPAVFGHEAAGVVAEVGEGVTSVEPGDHAVVSLLRACRRCFYCSRGSTHLCEFSWPLASQQRLHTADGEPVYQGIHVGAFAEAVVVHAEQCVPIPTSIPFDSGALLACGVVTGWGAVTNTAQIERESTVLVIGAGGVGLNSIQAAAAAGARVVLALDTAPEKLDAARRFGATHALAADASDVPGRVAELTDGRGADHAFITVGSPPAVERALELVRPAGTVVVVGIGPNDSYARLDLAGFASGERRILGSRMGSSDLSRDVPSLADRYERGELMLDELITGRYPLEKINEAIADLRDGSTLRNVVVFP